MQWQLDCYLSHSQFYWRNIKKLSSVNKIKVEKKRQKFELTL